MKTLPPSIDAGVDELVDARDMDSTIEFRQTLISLLNEACRLQREAVVLYFNEHCVLDGEHYTPLLEETPLVVECYEV